ncbi:NADP-dependent 3-hydroxy acid dehydrogenase YdfG [Ekhidna lutea]|uniref:NADP-dependent 3-hydroxy acid dehydrogenase YdfG n=1 Tax=Ekhidna lutea TaxID=447679 RepID=A0A239HX11_EKHLU|nr:oxidoreductase [Ekhidna lutea]SNS85859.1 NADP-dependent 3-hydroxy acid dehydrogenase YdfG [Ekhidna lutea]
MSKRVWLITGCSTGFGRELVKIVSEMGEVAIGTVRKQEQVKDLEAINPKLVKGVVLDVQKQDTINQASQFIEKEFGRLDVLVNNAGYGSLGPIEETSEEEIQRQFDVNVFGCVRMIKLALPFMRKQRSGHILNITSIAGLNGFPGVGIYNGSKFALEGIGEALAAETKHIGIHVTNIEPGPFRTDWAGRSATFNESSIDEYNETAAKNMNTIREGSGNQIGDPVRAAKAMYEVTTLENPPVHLPLGAPAYKRVGIRLQEFKEEIDAFRHIGKPTDYTEEELSKMDS